LLNLLIEYILRDFKNECKGCGHEQGRFNNYIVYALRRYLGIGYGMVEFEETYVEEDSSGKENLEYGSFFIVGYRFLKESGKFSMPE
jgi:hypothetical protein